MERLEAKMIIQTIWQRLDRQRQKLPEHTNLDDIDLWLCLNLCVFSRLGDFSRFDADEPLQAMRFDLLPREAFGEDEPHLYYSWTNCLMIYGDDPRLRKDSQIQFHGEVFDIHVTWLIDFTTRYRLAFELMQQINVIVLRAEILFGHKYSRPTATKLVKYTK